MLRCWICRSPTCCSSATSRRPATPRRRSACATGRREQCVGELSCAPNAISVGLPQLTPAEARARGARSMVIGVANSGGRILDSWVPSLLEALEAGLDIVSGMHTRLANTPALVAAAERHHRRLIDVRTPPRDIPIASGRKRSGKRLLTVGTDCALGKKYTALAIARAFKQRGVDADFRATGQTGIMIAGSGMPMDAVVADFEAGAAEMLSPDAAPDHWDVIEGQGSLFHPAYAGVSLGLLHGSQPDVIVVCHEPGRTHMLGHAQFELPSIEETIDLNLQAGPAHESRHPLRRRRVSTLRSCRKRCAAIAGGGERAPAVAGRRPDSRRHRIRALARPLPRRMNAMPPGRAPGGQTVGKTDVEKDGGRGRRPVVVESEILSRRQCRLARRRPTRECLLAVGPAFED